MNSDSIFTLAERYEIPLEAVIKSDLLRLGVSFSKEALQICAEAKPKSYFIFSFDRASQKDLSEAERRAVPEEIALIGGPYDLKRTIVSVRLNPNSPYRVEIPPDPPFSKWGGDGIPPFNKGGLGGILTYQQQQVSNVVFPKHPPYYNTRLKSGKPITDIAPTIEWGYLIYLTVFRLCQYFGTEEECQFCDINHNYRQQKGVGRPYTGIKSTEEILEALSIIDEQDPEKTSRCYTVTGGSITDQINGLGEVEFYARYARAIEEKFPGRWIGKANVQALPIDEVRILKGAGYQIYHPNFEVWDRALFARLCPGKEHTIGRDGWLRRVINSAEIFGPTGVIPNFVSGIEMAKPYGFKTVPEAIRSTAEGLDFFMSKGICPRFTVWCVEPNTALSKTNSEPPPLEYYVRLLQVYRETFCKYKLPTPPGYGEPGLGKAVFSVSAFMDILDSPLP